MSINLRVSLTTGNFLVSSENVTRQLSHHLWNAYNYATLHRFKFWWSRKGQT